MPVEHGYSQQVYLQEDQQVRCETTPRWLSPVKSHETSFYRKFGESGNQIINLGRLTDSSPLGVEGRTGNLMTTALDNHVPPHGLSPPFNILLDKANDLGYNQPV